MRRLLALLLFLPAACAGVAPRPPVQAYTPAELRRLSPQELYARFVGDGEGARVEDAWAVGAVTVGGAPISWINIALKPQPLDTDLCMRRNYIVDFVPVRPSAHDSGNENVSLRTLTMGAVDSLSLAPDCAELPGRRFATVNYRLRFADTVAILRSLAAARDSAAGPRPLPFRLACVDRSRERGFRCPADLRAVLAALPLQQAFSVERDPFPNNCDTSGREEGDAVEIGRTEDPEVWDVRLGRMGTAEAEIVLIRQFSRTNVKC